MHTVDSASATPACGGKKPTLAWSEISTRKRSRTSSRPTRRASRVERRLRGSTRSRSRRRQHRSSLIIGAADAHFRLAPTPHRPEPSRPRARSMSGLRLGYRPGAGVQVGDGGSAGRSGCHSSSGSVERMALPTAVACIAAWSPMVAGHHPQERVTVDALGLQTRPTLRWHCDEVDGFPESARRGPGALLTHVSRKARLCSMVAEASGDRAPSAFFVTCRSGAMLDETPRLLA